MHHKAVKRFAATVSLVLLSVACAVGQELSPVVPSDIDNPLTAAEYDFNEYGWRLFVAMNWPTRDGRPDPNRKIGQDPGAPLVWELYVDPITVFPHPDARLAEAVKGEGKHVHFMSHKERIGSGSEVIDDPNFILQAASTLPLIDSYGNYAVNEIRIDPDLAQFIRHKKFNDRKVMEQQQSITLPNGSIELKAGWRVFPPGWEQNHPVVQRYHTRPATIYVTDKQAASGKPFKIENALLGLLGLVGLHIIQKTPSQPGWIWTTFEQVDNNSIDYEPLKDLKPTFNSGNVAADDGKANRPSAIKTTGKFPTAGTDYKWRSESPYAGDYASSIVARCLNEVPLPDKVNQKWRRALIAVNGKTPWQYYRLNGVQWFEKRIDPLS